MFQSASFQGGFDATEDAFTFSYWDETKREWWFQLTAEEVRLIYEGTLKSIHIRLAQQSKRIT